MYIVLAIVWIIVTSILGCITSPLSASNERRIVKIPYLPMKTELFSKIKLLENSEAAYILHLHEKLKDIKDNYFEWSKKAEEKIRESSEKSASILWFAAVIAPPLVFLDRGIDHIGSLMLGLIFVLEVGIWCFIVYLFEKLDNRKSKYPDPIHISRTVEGVKRFAEANTFKELDLYYEESIERASDMEECIALWKAGPEKAIIKNRGAVLVAVAAIFVILFIFT